MYLKKIVIIGAGEAGKEIANEILSNQIFGKLVAFIDDDEKKIGTKLNGIEIFGPINNMIEINNSICADEAIIAIPQADRDKINFVYNIIKRSNIKNIKILPAVSQVITGDAHLILTRDIATEDLLGRTPITIPLKESLNYLRGKRVLITGAGGSIGSELSRQLLYGGAQRLYLLESSENALYNITKELKLLQEAGVGEKAIIVSILCNLQDKHHIELLLDKLKCDTIFHCAAYKHVPIMEENPVECIKNNLFGTKFLVDAAQKSGVNKFILISTDKAVSPLCVYGCSKLLAEEIVLSNSKESNNFLVVRFGNVLDSSGSIVPLFKSQIEKGGPLTVTDENVSRYFMTIPEASSLVLKAAGFGKSGNTYILDMGDPILIKDLAESMISFSGFKPYVDIDIKYTGLRPGEKLIEKLYEDYQTISKTKFDRINFLNRDIIDCAKLNSLIESLYPICFYTNENDKYRDKNKLCQFLKEYIPTLEVK